MTIPPPGTEERFLEPARRAARLMTMLAAMAALLGVFVFSVLWFVPIDDLLRSQGPEQEAIRKQLQQQVPPGQTLESFFRMVYLVGGSLVFVAAAALYTLGLFVRRGGVGAVVSAIVLMALTLIYLVFNVLFTGAGGGAMLVLAGMLLAIPLVVTVRTLRWLFLAAKLAPQIDAIRRHQGMRLLIWQQNLPPDDVGTAATLALASHPPGWRPPAAMNGPFAPFAVAGGFGYAQTESKNAAKP